MKKVKLVKMGMDFYANETGDMGNHRLRVQVINETPTGAEQRTHTLAFTDKNGHVVAGDFQFFRGNQYHPDALGWDFTDYGTDGEDSKAYRGLEKYFWHTLEPTRANIKMLLEKILDDKVELVEA